MYINIGEVQRNQEMHTLYITQHYVIILNHAHYTYKKKAIDYIYYNNR